MHNCIIYTQVHNPSKSEAVDLSGWQLHAKHSDKEQLLHVFEPGTVLPALGQLFVVQGIAAFRAAGKGARTMVVGLLPDWVAEVIEGAVFLLMDGDGTFVDQLNIE